MKEPKNWGNHFVDFCRDFGVVMLEAVFLLICTFLPWFFDLTSVFGTTANDPSKAVWVVWATLGKMAQALLLFAFWFLLIRKYNKDAVLLRTNVYHDHPIIFFWLAAFLGFKKCNLAHVPYYQQIYLVMKGVFEEFPLQEVYGDDETNNEPSVEYANSSRSTRRINLILEDTYSIDLNKIPKKCRNMYTTIRISRWLKDGVHKFSPAFVDKVAEVVSSLPAGTELNIFATTNPKNQEQITKKAFAKAGRGNITALHVYQQDPTEDRRFSRYKTI